MELMIARAFKEDIQIAINFAQKVTGKEGSKALKSMARALVGACHETGIDLLEYIQDYKDDSIFYPACLLTHDSYIFGYFTDDYVEFAKCMFELRPVGLGTPNAMVGEGEFLVIFASPNVWISKKKDEGDLIVFDEGKEYKIELKGDGTRLFHDIKGKEFNRKVGAIAKEYELEPNDCKGKRKGFEPWALTSKKKEFWKAAFNRIGEEEALLFLTEVCNILDSSVQIADLETCFQNEIFIAENLQKIFLKIFFKNQNKLWDYFTMISGEQIRCLSASPEEFNRLVDCDDIEVTGNFIRIFQDIKIGLYFGFSVLEEINEDENQN